MPELPEVETVARGLRRTTVGATISGVTVRWPGVVHSPLATFRRELPGRRVMSVRRHGKYLLIDLERDRTLVTHLRMTGQFRHYADPDQAPKPDSHTHVVLTLADPPGTLTYRDQRKFGGFTLVATQRAYETPALAKLGPDAMDALTVEHLVDVCANSKRPLKTLLLDQTKLAGIGNIYADELCFAIRTHPTTPANTLGTALVRRLHRAIKPLLTRAINAGGTTLSTFFDPAGDDGKFFCELHVFRKTGARCSRRKCTGVIERIRVAGRSTHSCPKCQPLPSRPRATK